MSLKGSELKRWTEGYRERDIECDNSWGSEMKKNVLGISIFIIGCLAVPAQSQDLRYPGPEQGWVQGGHQGVDDHRSGFHEQGMTPEDSAKVWVDNGYISYWLTTSRGMLGSLDEDLLGWGRRIAGRPGEPVVQ